MTPDELRDAIHDECYSYDAADKIIATLRANRDAVLALLGGIRNRCGTCNDTGTVTDAFQRPSDDVHRSYPCPACLGGSVYAFPVTAEGDQ